jgi:hypothetical protein
VHVCDDFQSLSLSRIHSLQDSVREVDSYKTGSIWLGSLESGKIPEGQAEMQNAFEEVAEKVRQLVLRCEKTESSQEMMAGEGEFPIKLADVRPLHHLESDPLAILPLQRQQSGLLISGTGQPEAPIGNLSGSAVTRAVSGENTKVRGTDAR